MDPETLIITTADIVGHYVTNNSVPAHELPGLIASVHRAVVAMAEPVVAEAPTAEPPKLPAGVTVKNSIQPDYLICLEDGKRYTSLKRHLAKLGLTPAQYRQKWSLPGDYPMAAPNYSAKRSELAKNMGLGSSRKAPPPAEPAKAKRKAPAQQQAA